MEARLIASSQNSGLDSRVVVVIKYRMVVEDTARVVPITHWKRGCATDI